METASNKEKKETRSKTSAKKKRIQQGKKRKWQT